ncbi:unnamed protein product [Cercospora beticola]|nr:unnamed protein product [Cercospora beticola]
MGIDVVGIGGPHGVGEDEQMVLLGVTDCDRSSDCGESIGVLPAHRRVAWYLVHLRSTQQGATWIVDLLRSIRRWLRKNWRWHDVSISSCLPHRSVGRLRAPIDARLAW